MEQLQPLGIAMAVQEVRLDAIEVDDAPVQRASGEQPLVERAARRAAHGTPCASWRWERIRRHHSPYHERCVISP